MTSLVEMGLSNALAALLLAIVAVVVGLVCRQPALVHALWLLVLLKLVTPPLVPVAVPWPKPVEVPAIEEEKSDELTPKLGVVFLEGPEGEDVAGVEEQEPVAPVEEELIADEAVSPAFTIAWAPWLGGAWVAGAVLWFAIASVRLWRFGRLLCLGRPAPRTLLKRVERLARRLELGRCPKVVLLPGRLAPMVWGVDHPLLLLPESLEEQLGADALETLLLHELAHLKRRDHLVRALEFVALGLYWWFPVVWFARRELREAEEQCCDAWVVSTLPRSGKLYASAIVDALDFLASPSLALPPLASGLGQVADLKRRLTMIMRGSIPHQLGWTGSLGVLVLAGLLLPLVPRVGQAQEPKKEPIRFREVQEDDLKRLEQDLKRKMEEIEAMRRKIEETQKIKVEDARKKAESAVKKAQDVIKEKTKLAELRGRDKEGAGEGGFRIEISGLKAEPREIEGMAKKLKEVFGGKDIEIIIRRDGSNSRYVAPRGEGERRNEERREVRPVEPVKPAKPATPPVPKVSAPPAPGMKGGDGRIENLERRLEDIMRQLESLRREMRNPPRPGSGGGGGFGGRGGAGGGGGPGGAPGRPGGAGEGGEGRPADVYRPAAR